MALSAPKLANLCRKALWWQIETRVNLRKVGHACQFDTRVNLRKVGQLERGSARPWFRKPAAHLPVSLVGAVRARPSRVVSAGVESGGARRSLSRSHPAPATRPKSVPGQCPSLTLPPSLAQTPEKKKAGWQVIVGGSPASGKGTFARNVELVPAS